MRISAFFCCSQQIFFYKVMHLHARKTVRRDVCVMGERLWRQAFTSAPGSLGLQNGSCIPATLGRPALAVSQFNAHTTIDWKKKCLKDAIKRDVSTAQNTKYWSKSESELTCPTFFFGKYTLNHHSFSVGPWSTWSHRTRHQCSCALQPSTLLPCAAAPCDKVSWI